MINWKEVAKKELKAYDNLKDSLQIIRAKIDVIEAEKTSLQSIGNGTPVQGGGNHFEDKLINLIVEQDHLERMYRTNQERVSLIERGLSKLTETERHVVETFAGRRAGKAVDLLRDLTGYEQAQIYRIYNEALYKYTITEYGFPEF